MEALGLSFVGTTLVLLVAQAAEFFASGLRVHDTQPFTPRPPRRRS